MKLSVAFALIQLIAASKFGLSARSPAGSSKLFPGDDESYLMQGRRHQYHVLMTKLARSQKVAVTQKQSDPAAARLRAKLSKILANGGLYFNLPNKRPKSIKANNRRNRFRKYHNWSLNRKAIYINFYTFFGPYCVRITRNSQPIFSLGIRLHFVSCS